MSANRPCSTAWSGKKLALVDDQPGVTRDRRFGPAISAISISRVIDTAGLEDVFDESLAARMREQTEDGDPPRPTSRCCCSTRAPA